MRCVLFSLEPGCSLKDDAPARRAAPLVGLGVGERLRVRRLMDARRSSLARAGLEFGRVRVGARFGRGWGYGLE